MFRAGAGRNRPVAVPPGSTLGRKPGRDFAFTNGWCWCESESEFKMEISADYSRWPSATFAAVVRPAKRRRLA